MDVSSKLKKSKWRNQYDEAKCKKRFNLDETCYLKRFSQPVKTMCVIFKVLRVFIIKQ